MIPLKDLTPHRSTPWMTFALIAANVAVFLHQLSLDPASMRDFMFQYGLIPARFVAALTTPQVTLVQAASPIFTSMFLHAGWMHIIGNMWFLWIFGDVVEDRLGRLRYLIFYLICGVGAAVTQTIFSWGSTVPTVGASGAISGVMGAYLILFPRSRVLTFVFIFTIRLPALLMVGYWFLVQFLSGLESLGSRQAGGVAFWAHVGGFVLGACLVKRMQLPTTMAYT